MSKDQQFEYHEEDSVSDDDESNKDSKNQTKINDSRHLIVEDNSSEYSNVEELNFTESPESSNYKIDMPSKNDSSQSLASIISDAVSLENEENVNEESFSAKTALSEEIENENIELQKQQLNSPKKVVSGKRAKITGTRRRIPSPKYLKSHAKFLSNYQYSGFPKIKKNIPKSDQFSTYPETSSDQIKQSDDSFSISSLFPPKSLPSHDDSQLNDSNDYYPQTPSSKEKDLNYNQNDSKKLAERKHSFIAIATGKIDDKGSDDDDDADDDSNISIISDVSQKSIETSERRVEQIVQTVIETEKTYEMNTTTIDEKHSEQIKTENEIKEGIPYLKDIEELELPINEEFRKRISFNEILTISQVLVSDEQRKSNKMKRLQEEAVYKNPLIEPNESIEIGALKLSIQSDSRKFITFCTSQFSCKNGYGGNKILAVIKRNLELIEDKKTEWHLTVHDRIEKILHVIKDDDQFVAFRTETKNKDCKKYRGNVTIKYTGDLVLDGGLFILMRYLILKNFKGEVKTWSMNIDGELCKCVLNVGKSKTFYIEDKPYQTIGIRKILYSENSNPIVSKTYFLPSGHIVKHSWKESKIFFHMIPCTAIPPPSTYISNLQKNWKDDVILVSKYLDYKSASRSDIETYIGDNPEFKSMLKDFILATIMQKPPDVLEFAIDFFLNICGGNDDNDK